MLREKGRYEEARDILSRGLLTRQPGLEAPNHEVAENLIALADLIVEMGAGSQAIPMYEEAVSILERSYGRQNPRAAATRVEDRGLSDHGSGNGGRPSTRPFAPRRSAGSIPGSCSPG